MERSFERDIIPMTRAEGRATVSWAWNVLASGKFRTDEEEERRREAEEKGREMLTGGWERTENEKKMSHALEKVAKEVGASHITAGTFHYTDHKNTLITGNAVAIAYVMQKTPYVFPFVGGRKCMGTSRPLIYPCPRNRSSIWKASSRLIWDYRPP